LKPESSSSGSIVAHEHESRPQKSEKRTGRMTISSMSWALSALTSRGKGLRALKGPANYPLFKKGPWQKYLFLEGAYSAEIAKEGQRAGGIIKKGKHCQWPLLPSQQRRAANEDKKRKILGEKEAGWGTAEYRKVGRLDNKAPTVNGVQGETQGRSCCLDSLSNKKDFRDRGIKEVR